MLMVDFERWRYKQFHVSYLLGWLALGMLGGLLIANNSHITISVVGAVCFVVLCLPALRSRRWWTAIGAVVIGMVLGMARGGEFQEEISGYESYRGKTIVARGVITTDPTQEGKGLEIFQLGNIEIGNEKLPGEIYATVKGEPGLKRGDHIRLKGELKEGFATYQARLSYATLVTVSRDADPIRDIREQFGESVRRYAVEPMASLGIGFVVGQRSSLPPELDEQLKIVGLTHIVVASGYNLTILVRFARRVLARHSRYLAFIVSLTLMFVFVSFSGLSPSMNRAVVITGLSLLAWYYGRRFHPVLLIGYVAAGTALWNPVYIWHDLGWYLSFFAFAGVLVVAPLIGRMVFKARKSPAGAQLVIETLSAELMTLPLIAFVFGTFPVFGLLANILVGPVIPAAMLATALAGVAGMLIPALAPLIALPATVIIGYVISVVEWLASLEWAQLSAELTLPLVLIWFALLISASLIVWRKTRYDFRSNAVTD